MALKQSSRGKLIEKLSAVLSEARRIVIKLNDKRVMPIEELSEAVPLKASIN